MKDYSKPIRVLQVFTILNRGGAESMIMNYYRNMDRNKVQFDFLVHRQEEGAFEKEIRSLGGKIYHLPTLGPFMSKKEYKNQLSKIIIDNNYLIIHSHLNAFNTYVLRVVKEFNIPVRIGHSHIVLPDVNFSFLFNSKIRTVEKMKTIYKQYIKTAVKKLATDYFACSIDAGIWLFDNKNIDKIKVINNAIDSNKFEYSQHKRNLIRNELKLNDTFVIGHIGRFNIQKNHNFLIDIFYKTKELNKNSKLLLIGEGELMQGIKQKVKKLNLENDVIFTGVQDNVSDYLQAMDVFVMPSFHEGLPVTLIEAQAAGLPVIASDVVTREVKITNLIEFVSLIKDAEYWAKILLKHTVDFKRNKMSDVIIKKNYDIKQNVLDLQEFYLNKIMEL